jgi:hypothetical protein
VITHELDVSAQNTEPYLDLLCAEDYYKQRARRLQSLRVLIATLTAAAGVWASATVGTSTVVTLAGIAGAVVVVLLDRAERSLVNTAANIKELFDTRLLGLRASALATPPPSEEEIVHRASAQRKRREALQDWYPDASGITVGFGRLLCQRASVVWDYRLRVRAGGLMLTAATVLVVGSLITGVALDLTLVNFLVNWVAPLSAALIVLLQSGWRHLEAGRERRRILEAIESTWSSSRDADQDVDDVQVRTIQDAIWRVRSSAPVIPRVLQWRLDRNFWTEMQVAGDRYKADVSHIGSS